MRFDEPGLQVVTTPLLRRGGGLDCLSQFRLLCFQVDSKVEYRIVRWVTRGALSQSLPGKTPKARQCFGGTDGPRPLILNIKVADRGSSHLTGPAVGFELAASR